MRIAGTERRAQGDDFIRMSAVVCDAMWFSPLRLVASERRYLAAEAPLQEGRGMRIFRCLPGLGIGVSGRYRSCPHRFGQAAPRAALAQPVEQRIRNAWVGCSSHPGGTSPSSPLRSPLRIPSISAAIPAILPSCVGRRRRRRRRVGLFWGRKSLVLISPPTHRRHTRELVGKTCALCDRIAEIT